MVSLSQFHDFRNLETWALLFIGSFIYAWTSFPFIHWIGPCIGLTVISASIFTIYLAAFSYLADAYLIYASSALAGQSLISMSLVLLFHPISHHGNSRKSNGNCLPAVHPPGLYAFALHELHMLIAGWSSDVQPSKL